MKDYLNRFGIQVVRLKPTNEAMIVHAFQGNATWAFQRIIAKGFDRYQVKEDLTNEGRGHSPKHLKFFLQVF